MIRILAKESLCYLAVVLIVQSDAIYARSLKLTFNTNAFLPRYICDLPSHPYQGGICSSPIENGYDFNRTENFCIKPAPTRLLRGGFEKFNYLLVVNAPDANTRGYGAGLPQN